jgi:hypothetical protein
MEGPQNTPSLSVTPLGTKWGTLLPSDFMKDIPFNKPHYGLSFLKKHPDIKINKFYPFNKKCR